MAAASRDPGEVFAEDAAGDGIKNISYQEMNSTMQREIVNVLNEPESVMLRRKDLTEQIKVMREAQKVIRRDPDLMSVMQININDSDIAGHGKDDKAKEKEKASTHVESKKSDSISSLFGKK